MVMVLPPRDTVNNNVLVAAFKKACAALGLGHGVKAFLVAESPGCDRLVYIISLNSTGDTMHTDHVECVKSAHLAMEAIDRLMQERGIDRDDTLVLVDEMFDPDERMRRVILFDTFLLKPLLVNDEVIEELYRKR